MATYDSSGTFSVDLARARQQASKFLEDPAQAILWVVQAAVASGGSQLEFRRSRRRLEIDCHGFRPHPQEACWARVFDFWQGAQVVGQNGHDSWRIVLERRASSQFLQHEGQFLREGCQFAPLPVLDQGRPLHSEHFSHENAGFHLAELYRQSDPPVGGGVAVLRKDAAQTGHRVNTPWTYWREFEGQARRVRWHFPQVVAGMVARHRAVEGFRCSLVALLQARPGLPNRLFAVCGGVVVENSPLDWDEFSGLTLIFDAGHLPVDGSGLKLVRGTALQGQLEELRQSLRNWTCSRSLAWKRALQDSHVYSPQLKREMGAWFALWGGGMLTGLAAFLPLPFLGLPWIMWHHSQRKKTRTVLAQRLAEFGPSDALK